MNAPEAADDKTREAVHAIWDELARTSAATPEVGLNLLLEGVGALIDSEHGLWLATCRVSDHALDDVLNGWRVRSVVFLREQAADQPAYQRAVKQLAEANESDAPVDESTYRHVREAGTFRVKRLVDHVSSGYFDTEFYAEHYRARGIRDRLFAVLPVSVDVESYFMFDRMLDQPPFEADACDLVSYALRGLTWFARQTHLSYGQLAAEKPLTASERSVLNHLLQGLANKRIARDIGQSPHTTSEHVKNIFRKFNVRSRSELMALWLCG